MAKLSDDKKSVTVEKGDTLSQIAVDYGNGKTYKQLAAINDIANPDLIYVGQVIKLVEGNEQVSNVASGSASRATITAFGLQSNGNNTLFATWKWGLDKTASYKVMWSYDTGDGVWFVGNNSTISVDKDDPVAGRQSTYNIPANAKQVKFKVKPISEEKSNNNNNPKYYWSAEWSTEKKYDVSKNPPSRTSTPSVSIEKYKLTASLDNIDPTAANAEGVEFQIVKDNSKVFNTGKAKITTNHVAYSCSVDAGGEYKVRCRAYKGSVYGEWSDYSNGVKTIPATPSSITAIRAASETSIYLEWAAISSATSYDIEYATKKEYFDGSDQTNTVTAIEFNHYEKTGLETGREYFFRVRAVNSVGHSAWSGIKSVTVGTKPAAPTTWSSTTTVITGEDLTLYWVHNSEDGSSQTFAELELYINGLLESHTIKNTTDENEKDKTSSYVVTTNNYIEGTTIEWRVRTAGVTKQYGEWSIQRTIDIYAPPTLSLSVTNINGASFETLDSFPFYIRGLASPKTQQPIGYHLVITANTGYEIVDDTGNTRIVNQGEQVYSRYFDTSDPLDVEISASNIDLRNNIDYTITCVVSMNSGLTAEATSTFTVAWTESYYEPNAEIGLDLETFTASIRPYYGGTRLLCYKVEYASFKYTVTETIIDSVYGSVVVGALTETGEQVYYGTNSSGASVYYCYKATDEESTDEDVLLSVYRREFDGGLTELAVGIDASGTTTITDPHPALDYARYRVVAKSKTTGAVSFYDVPGLLVGGKAVIIQWDERWTRFDTTEDGEPEQPVWSGSMVKLPYSVDVSDSRDPDVALIEYIGRKRPVSYYGTQLGESATWNVEIEKSDKDTLYALRRLSTWMGDVYVREPSGSGYWANITVSFSQKHKELTIPVTFGITRVEGGA